MPGVRLRATNPPPPGEPLLVPHPGGDGRAPKVYFLRDFEPDGCHITVSETVWTRLQEAANAGFPHGLEFVNVVDSPPRQALRSTRNMQRAHLVTGEGRQEIEVGSYADAIAACAPVPGLRGRITEHKVGARG